MGSGGKGGKQQAGWRHFAGFHHGICHGPIDALYQIHVDEREAWCGVATESTTISINKPDLFGGSEREGGIVGDMDLLFGESTQSPNAYLQSQEDVSVPAYRRLFSAVGKKIEHGLNPYLRPWRYRVQRTFIQDDGAQQWLPSLASPNVSGFGVPVTATGNMPSASVGLAGNIEDDPNTEYWDLFTDFGIDAQQVELGAVQALAVFQGTTSGTAGAITLFAEIAAFADDGAGSPGAKLQEWDQSESATSHPTFVRAETPLITLPAGTRHVGFRARIVFISPFTQSLSGGATGRRVDYATVETTVNGCDPDVEYPDSNPAHIIRESLINGVWGLGQSEADIDDDVFEAAANTHASEGMGLSLTYDTDGPIEDFINEVLDHVDGKVFVDRRSGLWKYKPIRESDPVVVHLQDADVLEFRNPDRRDPAEGANSVTVEFYDRKRAAMATRSLQDVALVAETGRQKSAEKRKYRGFTNEEIVGRVLLRELRAETAPVASGTLICTRAADVLNPGDKFRLTSTREGLDFDGELMRVDQIREGDDVIEVDYISDVFALGTASLVSAGPGEAVVRVRDAAALTRELAEEATYWQLVQDQGHTITDVLLGEDPDVGRLMIAASSTNGESNAQVWTDPGTGYVRTGSANFVPSAVTVGYVSKDPTETVIPITGAQNVNEVAVGDLARMGGEICRVDAISESSVTLGRGCLDTVPQEHAAGTAILFDDVLTTLDGEYITGESLDTKLLPVHYNGPLAIGDATAIPTTFASRAIRPLPAAQVQLDGEYLPDTGALQGTLPAIDWQHRDRLTQTSATLDAFTAASIGPEAGTDYHLEVAYLDPDDLDAETVVTDKSIGSGVTYTLIAGDFPAPSSGEFLCRVRVKSERAGYRDRLAFDFLQVIPGETWTADSEVISADSELFTADQDS